ncbi:hypothetical protein ACTXT7_004825 [Hymenolepis weldensis]
MESHSEMHEWAAKADHLLECIKPHALQKLSWPNQRLEVAQIPSSGMILKCESGPTALNEKDLPGNLKANSVFII